MYRSSAPRPNFLPRGSLEFSPRVLSAEIAGALLLIPDILTPVCRRLCHADDVDAAHYWMTGNGFFFTKAGTELPILWLALLGIQAVGGGTAPSQRSGHLICVAR